MWFAVLGPLQVRDGDIGVGVPKGRLRALLAVLVVRAGTVVSTDALAEVVWDGSPPRGAEVTLRSYVMRLRRVLGSAAGARIVTRSPGYLLQAGEEEVDLLRFRHLTREGGAAARAGQWARAWTLLGEGLRLWRGDPLADVRSEVLRREQAAGLEQFRLQALEWRADAGLELGFHEELVAELALLAVAHPLRERFHGQLMVALTRCGRQAEALEAYQRARTVLADELGTEPGAWLRELHQRILSADPAMMMTPEHARPAVGQTVAAMPRELPAPVAGFVGRAEELAELTGLLDRSSGQPPTAIVISAIGGTAGVGKTALAVQWAHSVAERFPDGQLYVNLRGYDPGQPMPATDVLAGFLLSLGMPGKDIPPEEGQRAARYRSLVAGKKLLIVLDNAGSAEQVRSLLPGSASCAVVVTSRDSLAGLVARHGAIRLELDPLPPAVAVDLLRELIHRRVDDDPAAATALARQCCRLPLALRVAAELAASRPDVPLADLTRELADQQNRLDLLDAGGDTRTAVRAVFSWSYRHLDPAAAFAFRLLSLHPGPDADPYAAAALTGATLPQACRALGTLARAHLIHSTGPGRYGMHNLLYSYARELTSSLDSVSARHGALTSLFDHYLYTAAAATDILRPAERSLRPRIARPNTTVPPLGDAVAAREWLHNERATLMAVIGHAAAHGWPSHAIRLAATLSGYLHNGGHFSAALTVLSHAVGAARRTGDRVAEGTALNDIGDVDREQGRYRQAADRYGQALTLFRAASYRAGEARALGCTGLAETGLGRYEQAARHQQDAAAIFRDLGDRFGEARALGNLGWVRQRQGRYQEATGYYVQSLDLCRKIGDRHGEAYALARLGVVDLRLGRYQHAAGYLHQALGLFRAMGHPAGEAEMMLLLSEVYVGLGRYEQAAVRFAQAVAMSREIGARVTEAVALIGVGGVLLHEGEAEKARAHYVTALRLASEADAPWEQARAHSGLARACQALGDPVQARYHWQEALARYSAIGAPEAGEIRSRLATTDGGI